MRFSSHIRSRLTDFGLHRRGGGCIHFGIFISLRPCDLYTVMPLLYTIELEGVAIEMCVAVLFVILPTLDIKNKAIETNSLQTPLTLIYSGSASRGGAYVERDLG